MIETILRVASTVSKTYRRKVWWTGGIPGRREEGVSSELDLFQEAMAAMLKAAPGYDPGMGSTPHAYFYTVAKRAVSSACWRMSAPVSAGSSLANLPELGGLQRAPLASVHAHAHADDVEQEVSRHEWLEQACEQVRARIREASPDGLAEAVLLDEIKPKDVAAARAVPVQKVYAAAARARARVGNDLDLWKLWRQER